jgi:hypothetical protein
MWERHLAVNVSAVHEVPEPTAGRRRDFRALHKLNLSRPARQARDSARRVRLAGYAILRFRGSLATNSSTVGRVAQLSRTPAQAAESRSASRLLRRGSSASKCHRTESRYARSDDEAAAGRIRMRKIARRHDSRTSNVPRDGITVRPFRRQSGLVNTIRMGIIGRRYGSSTRNAPREGVTVRPFRRRSGLPNTIRMGT